MSQREAAELVRSLGVSAYGSDFSRWENGHRKPDIDQANALITALRLDAYDFWRALGVAIPARTAVKALPPELVNLWPRLSPAYRELVLQLASGLVDPTAPERPGAR